MNQINVIKPYRWSGTWVFDDPSVGLEQEPFVAGMPEIIDRAVTDAGIENPEDGFVALFSTDPFPGAQVQLDWVRQDADGNVYRWAETGLEGWLCPALLRYFSNPPEQLFVQVKALE